MTEVAALVALVDVVGMDAVVELEELENGFAGGLGREGLGAGGDGRVGSTEGKVGVAAVLSTDGRTLATLGNTSL